MKRQPKTRMCNASKNASPLSDLYGWPIIELDANEHPGLGGFSRPRSSLTDVESAIRRAVDLAKLGNVGDLLVKPGRGDTGRRGWQVWEKRRVVGRVPCSEDSRAKRGKAGTGQVFVL